MDSPILELKSGEDLFSGTILSWVSDLAHWRASGEYLHSNGSDLVCYETVLLHSFHFHVFKLLKLYYRFLSILSLVLLDFILSRGFILFLKDIFHLIGIWSCGHYNKVQGWTHGKHMPDTCLPHVVHMYYCALLCNAVCTAFSIVLLISFHLTCTASSFHLPIMHSTY